MEIFKMGHYAKCVYLIPHNSWENVCQVKMRLPVSSDDTAQTAMNEAKKPNSKDDKRH